MPRRFSELVGNEVLKTKFGLMLGEEAVRPGISITGPEGCGKTSAGMLMIRRLCCLRQADRTGAGLSAAACSLPTIEPCCCCDNCSDDHGSRLQGGAIVLDGSDLTQKRLTAILAHARRAKAPTAIFLDDAHLAAWGDVEPLLSFLQSPPPNTTVVLTMGGIFRAHDALMDWLHPLQVSYPEPTEVTDLLHRVWIHTGERELSSDLINAIVEKHGPAPGPCIVELSRVWSRGIRTLDELMALSW